MQKCWGQILGILLASGFCHLALANPDVELVKNINVAVPASLKPANFCAFDSKVFFTATMVGQGEELWRTDGTEAGTVLVRDIFPGPLGSEPAELVVSNGKLFFTANDGPHGRELWVSDGTFEGTRMVVDVQPGNGSALPEALRLLKNGVSFFGYLEDQNVLVVSDGSEKGTRIIRGLGRTGRYLDQERIAESVVAGGNLLFQVYSSQGLELWKSDGSEKGTSRIRLMEPDVTYSEIKGMAAVGSTVYFSSDNGKNGFELWKSNGTVAGTRLVYDVLEGFEGSFPEQFTVLNGRVFFTALNENGTRGLWHTNGTADGTRRVAGVPGGGVGAGPQELTAAGGKLYFRFPSSSSRAGELWAVDGDPAQAALVKLIEPGLTSVALSGLVDGGNQLFFRMSSAEQGAELWVSDGSFAGTRQTRDVLAGAGSGLGASLKGVGGRVYFAGSEDGIRQSLWSSDGTEPGTVLIKSAPGDVGSDPHSFVRGGDGYFFKADDGVHGRELWFTDGTEVGTRLVKDLRPGIEGGVSDSLGLLDNGTLIFRANNGLGLALWQSDGTEAGTTLLTDMRVRPEHVQLRDLKAFDDKVFYSFNGRLWFAEGANPPQMVGTVTNVERIIRGGGGVFFSGYAASAGNELWKSDGTVSGTVLVKDFRVGEVSSGPRDLTLFHGNCYVLAHDGLKWELWKSDGTALGTIKFPLDGVRPLSLAASADCLYVYGQETGEGASSYCLMSMRAGSDSFEKVSSWQGNEAQSLRFLGNRMETLFFSLKRGVGLPVLWQSRGRADNTGPVAGGAVSLHIDGANIGWFEDKLLIAQEHETTGLEPYALPLNGTWSLARVNDDGIETAISQGEEVALFKQNPLREARLKLRLRNTGYDTIRGIQLALSEDTAGVYDLEGEMGTDLVPGAALDFDAVLTSATTGKFEALVRVSHAGAEPAGFSIWLSGSIVTEGAPMFLSDSDSRLALAGGEVNFHSSFLGQEPMTIRWLKNGRVVPGGVPLSFPAVRLSDAGQYALRLSNGRGSLLGKGVTLAVVQPAKAVEIFLEGETLSLECVTQAPKGTSLDFQWYRNGVLLPEVGRFSGTRTPRLRVSNVGWYDEGVAYDCRVTLRVGGRTDSVFHGPTELSYASLPMIDPEFQFPEVKLGESVNLTIGTFGYPERITAGGLPPGVVLNSRTGQLVGKPTRVPPIVYEDQEPYMVQLTAFNKAGKSETVTLPWYVYASVLPGSYDGLLTRNSALDGGKGLGSRVTLNATAQGVLSGRLYHGGKSYGFRSSLPAPSAHPTIGGAVGLVVSRGSGLTPLTLWVEVNLWSVRALRLSDGVGNEAQGQMQLRSFRGRQAPTLHRGLYTVAFRAAGVPAAGTLPEGWGYLTVTIGSSGMARWTGALADGVRLTGSTPICGMASSDFEQFIPIYALPYRHGRGSLMGWLEADAVTDSVDLVQVRGSLDWVKHAEAVGSAGRSYGSGIQQHLLAVQGGRYVPPARWGVVMGFSDDPNNARCLLQGAGLPSEISRRMTWTSVETGSGGMRLVKLDPVWEGAPAMKWQINAATGTFSGELMFVDENPLVPMEDVTRRTTMQGVLLSNQSMAAGHFMLAQLPEEGSPATTPVNSPLLSGRVEVMPATSTLSPEFAAFAAGTFQMGDSLGEGEADELPVRSVTLNAFVIQKKEVTLEEWRAVMEWALKNGYDFDNTGAARAVNHPVQGINWYDVVKWCNARSEMEQREPCYYIATPFSAQNVYRSGRVDVLNANLYLVGGPSYLGNGYRLPTEAEWECAARGGVNGRRFPSGGTISHTQAAYFAEPTVATLAGIDVSATGGYHPVFGARGSPFTAPVGRFPANPAGIYDVSGNVAEWCWDWLAAYAPGSATNPKGADQPALTPKRVLRGGSGQDGAMQARCAAREAAAPGLALSWAGFRVVRKN